MGKLLVFIVAFLVFGLFMVSLINGGILLARANNATQSIGDNPAVRAYAEEINKTLADSQDLANSADTSLDQSPTTVGDSNLIIEAMGGVWRTVKLVPVTIWNIQMNLLRQTGLFGEQPGIVIAIIASVLTITFVIYVIHFVMQGDG